MDELKALQKELSVFFSGKSPQSMIIAGKPGTGKTTFSLQLLELFQEQYKGIYLSTRVGDKALYQQFPWLKTIEKKTKIIDSGRVFLNSMNMPEIESITEPTETARKLLQDIYHEPPIKVSRTLYNTYFKNLNIPELKRIYNEIDQNLPERSILVIDSIEGLASKYRINEEDLVYTLVKDLVEGGNTDVILVLEKERSDKLEYIVDGVIGLEQDLYDGRKYRSLSIEKFRGVGTEFKKYLITLNNGKFYVFPQKLELGIFKTFGATIPFTESRFSTGIKDLDTILGGGFQYGTFNLISIGEEVGIDHHYVTMPIMSHALLSGKSTIGVLMLGTSIEETRARTAKYIGDRDLSIMNSHAIFLDYTRSSSDKKYIIALGNASRENEIKQIQSGIEHLRKPGNLIVYYLGFNTIEKYRGSSAVQETVNFVNSIIDNRDIAIGMLLPGSKVKDAVINMASTHIKIVAINNTTCLYGISPKTNLFVLEPDQEKIFKLVPII